MTEASVEPASDLFERGSVGATPFRIWWDSVVLWLERRRNPLSATQDLYPIVNRYYRPRKGVKSPPNPSYHLTGLKGRGLYREFPSSGSEGVLEPVTDKVIVVDGKVVYMPDMLKRMREFDVEALLKDGISAPPVATKRTVKPPSAPPVATPDAVSHEPCLAGTHEAVMIGPQLAEYAEAVMRVARAGGYAPLSSVELNAVHRVVNPEVKNPAGVTYELEQAGLMRMVAGKKMAGTAMRVVVFGRYRVRYSPKNIGEEIVPPECASHEPVAPPVVETVIEPEPVEQVPATPPAAETTVEPEPVSTSSGMLAQLRERRAQLDQAEEDAMALEREEAERDRLAAERDRLAAELKGLVEAISALDSSIAERHTRLTAFWTKFTP